MRIIALQLLTFFFIVTSCKKDDEGPVCLSEVDLSTVDQIQLQKDIEVIDQFLSDNGIVAIEHESGLRYVLVKEGSGDKPSNVCNKVLVNYEGRLLSDNSLFDNNSQQSFQLDNLILGWQIGFLELNRGASATLYIPSVYAYGTTETVDTNGEVIIPANANLVFEVDLIDFI